MEWKFHYNETERRRNGFKRPWTYNSSNIIQPIPSHLAQRVLTYNMVRKFIYKLKGPPHEFTVSQLSQQLTEIYNRVDIIDFWKKVIDILNYCYRQLACRLQNSGSVSDQECRGTPTDSQIPFPDSCIPLHDINIPNSMYSTLGCQHSQFHPMIIGV